MGFPLDFALAFGVVFLAEFADKTQLALLAMSSGRGSSVRVWIGAAAAFLLLTFGAAVAGEFIQGLVPRRVVVLLAAGLFILFGIKSLRNREEGGSMGVAAAGVLPAFSLIFVAELGDKTQLAVAALAAESGAFWATALGGTIALWASAALAILIGSWIGRNVRPEIVQLVGAAVFLLIGSAMLLFEVLS